MNTGTENRELRGFRRIVLRALVSTAVIGLVSVAVISIRTGNWAMSDLGLLVLRNWRLGVLIFCALVIWDSWFERSLRLRRERKE